MLIRSLILMVLTILWISHVQASSPLEAGVEAFDQARYLDAHKYWLPLAEDGDTEAQNESGLFYELGLWGEQDIWVAESWYERVRGQDYCLADTLPSGRLEALE